MDEENSTDSLKVTDTVEPMSEIVAEPLPDTVNGEVKMNGEHVEVKDKTDAPLRSPPQTAPKPSRESRTSKVFCKFKICTCKNTTRSIKN